MKLLNKSRLYLLAVVALIVGASIFAYQDVFADQFDGNDTNGVSTNCAKFLRTQAYTRLCGDNGSLGGGASWHLYKTSSSAGPVWVSNDSILGSAANAITMDEIRRNCSQYDYFVAYGWEGPYRSVQYGPAKYGTGLIATATYNNYGGASYEATVAGMNAGNIGDDTHLAKGVAEGLLSFMSGGRETSFRSGSVGYFCANAPNDQDPPEDPYDNPCIQWAPASYYSSNRNQGTTSVISRVRNTRLSEADIYGGWQEETTYAMPGDKIEFRNCYFPGVQKTANTIASKEHGREGVGYYYTANTNLVISSFYHYDNYFNISLSAGPNSTYSFNTNSSYGFVGPVPYEGSFNVGDSYIRSSENIFQVKPLDTIARTFRETITTGSPVYMSIRNDGYHRWCAAGYHCCCGCKDGCCSYSCCCGSSRHSNRYYPYSPTRGPVSDYSQVKVPYNFMNLGFTEIAEADSKLAYSGETINVSNASIWIAPKYNGATNATYATEVHKAEVRLVGFVANKNMTGADNILVSGKNANLCAAIGYAKQCAIYNSLSSQTLNPNDIITGSLDTFRNFQTAYNVFDASAGDYMCFTMSVYPSSSGVHWTEMNASGSNEWLISHPVCTQIAKRPSFHVYGGSLYTDGDIDVSVNTKRNTWNNLYGYDIGWDHAVNGQFQPTSTRNTIVYGSWVDQSIIALGRAKLIASGASLGYSTINNQKVMGGNEKSSASFCKNRTTLSFANYTSTTTTGICPYSEGYIGKAGMATPENSRQALADYWQTGAQNVSAGATIDLSSANTYSTIESATGKQIRYSYSSGNISVQSATIGKNITHIIKSDNNIAINGDIIYANDTYTNSSEIPQVIISARNISIACSVQNIDAVLIASETVNTCTRTDAQSADENDINSADRSKQLNIRGVVIANGIVLGRTFGNAVGDKSGIPAETINYDTSTLLWGQSMADSAERNYLSTTYITELSPRY